MPGVSQIPDFFMCLAPINLLELAVGFCASFGPEHLFFGPPDHFPGARDFWVVWSYRCLRKKRPLRKIDAKASFEVWSTAFYVIFREESEFKSKMAHNKNKSSFFQEFEKLENFENLKCLKFHF